MRLFGRRRAKDARDTKLGGKAHLLPPRELNVCSRYCAEFCMPPYQMEEADGRLIDLHASFAPKPSWISAFIKFILFAAATAIMTDGLLDTTPTMFFFAYITNWSLTVTLLYFFCSLLVTLYPPFITGTTNLPFLIKLTWMLFSVAAPAELTVTVLYWGLEFSGDLTEITYRGFMVHGVFMILLFWEGFSVNRIPVRISQQWLFFLYMALYLGWTLLHAYYLEIIGDPTSTDDDVIYTNLTWIENPAETGIVAAIALFFAVPLAFVIVWLLSLFSFPCSFNGRNRKYLDRKEARETLVVAASESVVV
jgi:hypothetical protein